MAREKKAMDTSNTTVEVLEELTPDEEKERHRLEWKVERAFYEAGSALRLLRDKRLYRSTHRTFESYCQERFGYTRRRPYQLIEAAIVFENLCTIGTQSSELDDSSPINRKILPTNERQVRDLIKLSPTVQREVWHQAVVAADGKVPTSHVVKGIVERLKEKPLFTASNFCDVGEVFTLTLLQGTERKYNGYPCVAVELKHFTLDVDVYDMTLTVKPENLKPIDDPDIRRQLPAILQRIKRVRNVGMLDRGTYYVLDGLGRQMYLTDFEEKLLSFLEKEYGIESNS